MASGCGAGIPAPRSSSTAHSRPRSTSARSRRRSTPTSRKTNRMAMCGAVPRYPIPGHPNFRGRAVDLHGNGPHIRRDSYQLLMQFSTSTGPELRLTVPSPCPVPRTAIPSEPRSSTRTSNSTPNLEPDRPLNFPSYVERAYTTPPEASGGRSSTVPLDSSRSCRRSTPSPASTLKYAHRQPRRLWSDPRPTPSRPHPTALAQLGVLGAHYFIPVNFGACLEFLRFYAAVAEDRTRRSSTITTWVRTRHGVEVLNEGSGKVHSEEHGTQTRP